MARGDKNYDKRTHAASKKDTKGKQKEVWDMIGAKKKLHEMVEALINSDSKTAAAALHDYLQVKTKAILGETDEEGSEDDMVADRSEEGEGEGEHDHEDGEECAECGMEPCECEDKEEGEGEGDHEEHSEEDGEGEEEHSMFGEGNETKATPTFKGAHNNAAKDLDRKVKGTVNFDKTSGSGSKRSASTEATPTFKGAHNNAAKDLDRKVKGKVNFEKSSGSGSKKSNSTEATPTMKGAHNNAAKDLNRKQKGATKFSSSTPRKNT